MNGNEITCNEPVLACVIVEFGKGGRVLDIAEKHRILLSFAMLGNGTVYDRILHLTDMSEKRREIVIMVTEKRRVDSLFEDLENYLKLSKHHHGIAFTFALSGAAGFCNSGDESIPLKKKEYGNMYEALFVVVDRGLDEEVVECIEENGGRGATLIHARGGGKGECEKVFGIEIEAEKEMVLTIVESSDYDRITDALKEMHEDDKRADIMFFSINVDKTLGLFS